MTTIAFPTIQSEIDYHRAQIRQVLAERRQRKLADSLVLDPEEFRTKAFFDDVKGAYLSRTNHRSFSIPVLKFILSHLGCHDFSVLLRTPSGYLRSMMEIQHASVHALERILAKHFSKGYFKPTKSYPNGKNVYLAFHAEGNVVKVGLSALTHFDGPCQWVPLSSIPNHLAPVPEEVKDTYGWC